MFDYHTITAWPEYCNYIQKCHKLYFILLIISDTSAADSDGAMDSGVLSASQGSSSNNALFSDNAIHLGQQQQDEDDEINSYGCKCMGRVVEAVIRPRQVSSLPCDEPAFHFLCDKCGLPYKPLEEPISG